MDEDISRRELPEDFSVRCVFRIECELPGNLVYGSRVRLVHLASDCKMVASTVVDPLVAFKDASRSPAEPEELLDSAMMKRRSSSKPKQSELRCVFLRRAHKKFPNNEDIWVTVSRYKMREEGESIYSVSG